MANFNQCFEFALDSIQAGQMLHIQGKPGVGKSSISVAIAEEMNLIHIPFCVNAREPVDLNGYPIHENGRARYVPFREIPLDGLDTVPKGKNGWLIDLEEIDQADPSMQKALHRFILERAVGEYKLHPKVFLIGSGNRPEDRAHASVMSSALQSRMNHITLDSNVAVTSIYGVQKGWSPLVIGYINFRVSNLNNFNGQTTVGSYACERNWERVSKMLKIWEKANQKLETKGEELSGMLGESAALDFIAFAEIKDSLITIPEILADPLGVDIPYNAGALYAITASLCSELEEKDFKKAYSFINRIPLEYQILGFRSILSRFPKLINSTEINIWTRENGDALYNF